MKEEKRRFLSELKNINFNTTEDYFKLKLNKES